MADAKQPDQELELNRQEELTLSRRSMARQIESKVRQLAKKLAQKLEQQIRDGNDASAITILIFLAFLKDGLLDIGLDFLGIGIVPIIGQIPGWFVSATLFYFMYGKGYFLKQRAKMNARIWLYVLSFIFDGLPAIEALPVTTITVLHTIKLMKKRARQAKEDLTSLYSLTKRQLESLQKELYID